MANINGTPGNDTLIGTDGVDIIDARSTPSSGSDTVQGLGGDDVLYGATQSGDVAQVSSFDGGDGNDVISFTVNNEAGLKQLTLLGGAGNDAIYLTRNTGYFANYGYSGAFGSTPMPPPGTVSIDGGPGTDTAYLALSSSDVYYVLPTISFANVEHLVIIGLSPSYGLRLSTEQVTGVGGNISLATPNGTGETSNIFLTDGGTADFSMSTLSNLRVFASGGAVRLTGSSGDDSLNGSGGADVIHGGPGNDLISSGYGYPGIGAVAGQAQLFGDAGDDTIVTSGTNFLVDGGTGTNTWQNGDQQLYISSGQTYRFDNLATAQGINFSSNETVRNIQVVNVDLLNLGAVADTIYAGAGGGTIRLLGAPGVVNTLYSGAGSDTLTAANVILTPGGQDVAAGYGASHVVADFSSATGPVMMQSAEAFPSLGPAQPYSYIWTGASSFAAATTRAEVVIGPSLTLDVTGSSFNDVLVGDTHTTSPTPVNLYGGGGDDLLVAGLWDGTYDGGSGTNTLSFDLRTFHPTDGYGSTGGYVPVAATGVTVNLGVTTPQATGYGIDTILDIQNLTGGAGNDVLIGNAGVNVLDGGPGSDILDGGPGIDTAIYHGPRGAYTVVVSGGTGTVSGGPEGGTDQLTSVENLRFTDGTLTSDPASAAAEVERLYQAAFGRAPDGDGFDYYVHQLMNGTGALATLATAFAASPEFAADTRGFSDKQFVDYLYGTVLHRAPDGAGEAFYTGDLAAGDPRANVLKSFSESPENVAGTAGALAAGLFVRDHATEVQRLYDAAFGRLPDGGGQAFYTAALDNGLTSHGLALDFLNSAEFQAKSGGLDDKGFVDLLYQTTLHRAPDAGGEAFYTAQLQHGLPHADLLLAFSDSTEHALNLQPLYDNGVLMG